MKKIIKCSFIGCLTLSGLLFVIMALMVIANNIKHALDEDTPHGTFATEAFFVEYADCRGICINSS